MVGLTGILLCGGKSLRMGSDKALLELQKQPMVSYPLRIMQQRCSEIFMSANDARLDFFGYSVICDEVKDIGPMGGIYTCLKKSTNNINFVLACDMPLVNGALLEKMLQIHHDYDIIVPVVNQRAEPLHALYHKRMIGKIKNAIDQKMYSLQKLLSIANVYYMHTEVGDIYELLNVNTPAELKFYEQLEGNGSS